MSEIIAGIAVPDSAMARAVTEFVRDVEDDLLFNHSRRVFFWAALTADRRPARAAPLPRHAPAGHGPAHPSLRVTVTLFLPRS